MGQRSLDRAEGPPLWLGELIEQALEVARTDAEPRLDRNRDVGSKPLLGQPDPDRPVAKPGMGVDKLAQLGLGLDQRSFRN
jgi:hypothetical protein